MTTPMPLSPFITEPDNRFVLDEAAFMAAIEEPPAARPENFDRYQKLLDELADIPPLFLSDPSDDFIAAMHRDVLPVIEDAVRRGA